MGNCIICEADTYNITPAQIAFNAVHLSQIHNVYIQNVANIVYGYLAEGQTNPSAHRL